MKSFPLACTTALALALSLSSPAALALSEAEQAMQTLNERSIPISNDSFVAEVQAGHVENVQLMLKAGAAPATQNQEGLSGLAAAYLAGNKEMWDALYAALPADAPPTFNLQDKDGNTLLMNTIERGDNATSTLLLDRGADFRIANRTQTTPLLLAIQKKNGALVKKLLALDAASTPVHATVEHEDTKGNKALTYAVMLQQPEIVKDLLAATANAIQPDTLGITPLMLAAEGGDESIVRMLLAAGAKINTVSKSGHTPVSIAIRHGHSGLARMMMEQDPATAASVNYTSALSVALDADPVDTDFFRYLLDHTAKNEPLPTSLLFKALDRRAIEVAKILLERNPDIKALNDKGETLFYHAVDSRNEDIALAIMNRGADVTQTGAPGITPLARAVTNNMPKVVDALLKKGASGDQKTPDGYTLAEVCVYRGFPETLQVLLDHGVKLQKDFALLWSIRDGKGKVVPVLLAHGAVANIMNQEGIPAISLAAEAGQTEAVKAFIAHKASLTYPSKNERMTPLATAAHAGNIDIVRMLVEAGSALEAVDGFGMTPLAHAAVLSKPEVVEYLLSKGANPRVIDNQKRSVSDIAGMAPATPEREKVMQLLAAALAQSPK